MMISILNLMWQGWGRKCNWTSWFETNLTMCVCVCVCFYLKCEIESNSKGERIRENKENINVTRRTNKDQDIFFYGISLRYNK